MRIGKTVKKFLGSIFHTRKVLIISDKSVDYYPMSLTAQLVVVLLIAGAVSWGSYSTGSYVAAQSQIAEKDQEIADFSAENKKIEEEYALLKRDLMKVQENDGKAELSEYTKFVIDQYENDDMAGIKNITMGNISHSSESSMVFERMNFLEQRIQEMNKQKLEFIDAIKRRTQNKIKTFRSIIKSTGLNRHVLEQKQASYRKKREKDIFDKKFASTLTSEDPKGGPFIPAESSAMFKKKKSVLKDIEKLMLINEVVEKLPLAMPIRNARITSGFGRRADPFNRRAATHSGQDFAGPSGSRVYSTARGKVTFAGRRGGYGKTIEISHGYGVLTRYAHLSAIKVKVGQYVPKGKNIGIQGSTGRSTGQHLHYEIRYNNVARNPMRFIKAGRKYVQAQK